MQIIGLQPAEGSSIPGIRRWAPAYLPGIFRPELVDQVLDIEQRDAEQTMRQLAQREGIFCGVSSGGAVAGALRVAAAHPGSVVVAIVCDRGDRYLYRRVRLNVPSRRRVPPGKPLSLPFDRRHSRPACAVAGACLHANTLTEVEKSRDSSHNNGGVTRIAMCKD